MRHRVAEEAASTDSLTGLKNRRAFEEEAAEALVAASHGTAQRRFALCLIDIDRFKQVNDRHGHLAGDAILEALGRRDRGDGTRLRLPARRRRVRPAPRADRPPRTHERLVAKLQREFAASAGELPVDRAGHDQRRHRRLPRSTRTICTR